MKLNDVSRMVELLPCTWSGTDFDVEASARVTRVFGTWVVDQLSVDDVRLVDGGAGAEFWKRLPARVQIALFAEGDHLLHVRANRLGLGHGRLHAVFHNNGRDQVTQQSRAMAGIASELESCIAMAHDVCYSLSNPLISVQCSVIDSLCPSPETCGLTPLIPDD